MKGSCVQSARALGQRGVSLIEVLVTIVVLSLGLLGLAALQALGLKAGESSHYRANAAFLAQDMVDRMRANLEAARSGKYNLKMGDPAPDSDSPMENVDRKQWFAAMKRALPDADAAIEVDKLAVGDSYVVTVTVQWDDRRGERKADKTLSNFVLKSQL